MNRDKIIGAQLRKLRQLAGLSQVALASQCGITFQQLQKYEKGINRLTITRLLDIATALKVSPEKFYQELAGKEDKQLLSPLDMKLVKAFQKLSDEAKARLLIVLKYWR